MRCLMLSCVQSFSFTKFVFVCGWILSCLQPLVLRGEEGDDFFESKIRPVLIENCYRCHSAAQKVEGGLRLDTRSGSREGGDSGAAILPGDLEGSLLLSAIKYDSFEMPPDRKLPDHVIQNFEHWIATGAADPREETTPGPEREVHSEIDFDAGRDFWSLKAPQPHRPRANGRFEHWAQNAIDPFIADRLEQEELQPSPPASDHALRRRLSFDLVGLPPGPDRATQTSPKDREALSTSAYVDQLLASDAFGEHWARMWLDLMRYADDQAHIVGNNTSLCYPNAHRYRTWVITALNEDLPFNRFVQLQLAADLLTPEDRTDDVALGFVGLGPKYYRRNSPEVMADELEDRVDILSRGLLGLTVACARCHDHKYDPIGTADYYALAGVFASTEMYNWPLNDAAEVDKNGQAKKPEQALHIIRERKKPVDLPILIRGDVKRRGQIVKRGFLQVLAESEARAGRVEFESGSGRLELAQQITSRTNPLTARVFVNRVWSQLIGQPLVATPSNFGNLGARPTHPELLDDLAFRFMEHGWSLKWLCREIVLSATYQQSSSSDANDRDPENHWLSRMNAKRLTVEQWRDSLLVASRLLDQATTVEDLDPSQPGASPRTIYSDSSRLRLNSMLALFDYPDPNAHSANRVETTTASQKLFLMNSPFMIHCAEALADDLKDSAGEVRIEEAYQRLFNRSPSPAELRVGKQFLSEDGNLRRDYLHALMMTNEFFFLD